jgi:hypothetical protein
MRHITGGRAMVRIEPATLAPGLLLPRTAPILSDRRLVLAVAAGIALVAGLLTSFVAPRGPTTMVNAPLVMAGESIVRATYRN